MLPSLVSRVLGARVRSAFLFNSGQNACIGQPVHSVSLGTKDCLCRHALTCQFLADCISAVRWTGRDSTIGLKSPQHNLAFGQLANARTYNILWPTWLVLLTP